MGNALALGCAITWSMAVVIFKYSDKSVHPLVVNVYKNVIGSLLFIPTLYIFEGQLIFPTTLNEFLILGVSGVIGIGIADGLFLRSLKLLGAGRMAIIDCTYSPFIIFLSLLIFGESLNAAKILGIILILSSVFAVSYTKSETIASKKTILVGSLLGALSILLMAIGILMIKPLFDSLPVLWIIEVRLIAGLIASLVMVSFLPRTRFLFGQLLTTNRKLSLTVASVFATYISMMMWVSGFKYNDASITAALNQTATIFTVIFAAIFLRERLTPVKIGATVAATIGVIIITLY